MSTLQFYESKTTLLKILVLSYDIKNLTQRCYEEDNTNYLPTLKHFQNKLEMYQACLYTSETTLLKTNMSSIYDQIDSNKSALARYLTRRSISDAIQLLSEKYSAFIKDISLFDSYILHFIDDKFAIEKPLSALRQTPFTIGSHTLLTDLSPNNNPLPNFPLPILNTIATDLTNSIVQNKHISFYLSSNHLIHFNYIPIIRQKTKHNLSYIKIEWIEATPFAKGSYKMAHRIVGKSLQIDKQWEHTTLSISKHLYILTNLSIMLKNKKTEDGAKFEQLILKEIYPHQKIITISSMANIMRMPNLGRNLFSYYEHYPEKRTLTSVISLFIAILEKVKAIHALEIIHGDLKPDNILIDNNSAPHIIDFNLSKKINKKLNYFFGTFTFCPPERFSKSYNVALNQDIYSLGIILCCMIYSKTPFSFGTHLKEKLDVIHKEKLVHDENTDRFLILQEKNALEKDSLLLHPMIKKMILFKPDERYQSCDEVIKEMNALKI